MAHTTHKDLKSWQRAIELVTKIYEVTQSFPDVEKYGLSNQIRRAAISIPSNIAEGAARKSEKENIQFLYIALGSVAEVETQLIISRNLDYIDEEQYQTLNIRLESIRKPLIGLIKYLKQI